MKLDAILLLQGGHPRFIELEILIAIDLLVVQICQSRHNLEGRYPVSGVALTVVVGKQWVIHFLIKQNKIIISEWK